MKIKKLWTRLFTRNSETVDIALHVAGATVRHRNPFENMEAPRNDDELSKEFIEKRVTSFYMTHLALAGETTIATFARAAKEINIDIVRTLLGDFNWRTRITGAYFAAINYRELLTCFCFSSQATFERKFLFSFSVLCLPFLRCRSGMHKV